MKQHVHFIVTAGPTREYLDPVRFLSNPSTGRMGFAVARAASRFGRSGGASSSATLSPMAWRILARRSSRFC